MCSSSLWTRLHHMAILRSQNKITDFLMILAWAVPLTIIIVSLKHITQYSGHFYFERALIVNNVFIIEFFYNMN